MNILPYVKTLQEFERCLPWAFFVRGKFSILQLGRFTFSQLLDKYESLPKSDEGLQRRVFRRLLNLEGTDPRIDGILKQQDALADEAVEKIPKELYKVLSIVLPVLLKSDPSAAATLIHYNDEAKAIAMKLPGGDGSGNSLFAIAEGIFDWEENHWNGIQRAKFDSRFTLEQHNNDLRTIIRIQDWEKFTGLRFDKRFSIEQHLYDYTRIFDRHLAEWTESPTGTDRIKAVRGTNQSELDLRGLPITTIPEVVGSMRNVLTLYVDEQVVLPYLPRWFELNLIANNPSIFRNFRPGIRDDERFMIRALNCNGEVLKLLPPELQDNRDFLLRAAEKAPTMITHVHEDEEFMNSLVKAAVFGKEAWEKYFGAVGDVPPLPENIWDILNSPDPFNPRKKVAETHLLLFLPQTIDGNPLTLHSMEDLVKQAKVGYKTLCRYIWPRIRDLHGSKVPAEGKWILMTKDVVPGSRNLIYAEQQALVQSKEGYFVPDLLSAAVVILTHCVRTGQRLFSGTPRTYTRCSEVVDGFQVTAGGYEKTGLIFHDHANIPNYVLTSTNIGVAAMRRVS